MKYFLRPYLILSLALVLGVGAGLAGAPPGASAQTNPFGQLIQQLKPLISHSSSQGYLGVMVGDVDTESVAKLRL
jgi:hypothetical protein